MATKIIPKKSSVAAKVPLTTDLDIGELALNLADKKIYTKDSGGTVIELSPIATASEILTSIKTVDGTGSGLDADLLDGNEASAFYLATNPSGYTSNLGTVTSVAASVPTGLTVSGSPITSSGTLTIAYAAGYQGYTSTEATKLSGIEAGADITDAANVEPLVDTHLNTSTATTGEVLSWTGTDYDWAAIPASATVNASAPVSPSTGDLWWDTDVANLFVYDGAQWVEATPSANPFTYDSGTSTYTLTGNMTVTGDINSNSDISLKTNVQTFANGLEAVKSLRGVRYDRIETGKASIGLIAQEVETILPELVAENLEGLKSLQYANIVAVLIEAIKELSYKVEELEKT